MTKMYSIAEARRNLAAFVHDLERKDRIELTRRGEPVAVLLSMRACRNLSELRQSFWEAHEAFRAEFPLDKLDIQPATFTEARDRSPGREMVW